ncbi:MAG TPA: WD40 repeat domain-containing protein, partial [Gemmataceae bacterium]|nr:WD40 repeat domain-containing protein [Gemmataceae bacterium]
MITLRRLFLLSLMILAASEIQERETRGAVSAQDKAKKGIDGALPAGAIRQFGTSAFLHEGKVSGVAFSPDSKLMASGGKDAMVRLWDVVGGKEVHSFPAHRYGVITVAFSPDGKTLAGGGETGGYQTAAAVYCWDIAAKQVLWQVHFKDKGDFAIGALAYSPDGKVLAGLSNKGTIFLWEAATGLEIRQWQAGQQGIFQSLAFAPKGSILACGGVKAITLWHPETGKEMRQFSKGDEQIWFVAFSPDGSMVAGMALGSPTVRALPLVHLWDTATGKVIRDVDGHQAAVFTPNGKTLVTATGTRFAEVALCDVATGAKAKLLQSDPLSATKSSIEYKPLAISPDGRLLAVTFDRAIHLWDLNAGKLDHPLSGHVAAVVDLAVTRDGRFLTSASHDQTVRQWEVASGKETGRLKGKAGALSADGKTAATLQDGNKTLRISDMATL